MRILSIAGENIASLAEPFRIDLTAEPLRSAGLFAITGPTGAGKSSILDAMCLALFGEAPRLESGSRERVPDAGDEALEARDPRAVLRRGATQGWAEVGFTAEDGADYLARWTVRRAHRKADGKLQKADHTLLRAADGQVVASQAGAVRTRIEALAGLSWHEFRRSVLLAQGEVDAFLRAETNDRAQLLERVTGTSVYRNASVAVFERDAAARASLEALVLRRGEHRTLDDLSRQALESERAELARRAAEARQERDRLTAVLDRHRRRAEAAELLAAARARCDTAEAAFAGAEDQRRRIAAIARAEPSRPVLDALRARAADLRQAIDRRTAAEAALTAARDLEAQRSAEQAAAATAAAAAAAAVDASLPDWRAATELDTRLAAAEAEVARAAETLATARDAADRAARALAADRSAADVARNAAARAAEALDAVSPFGDLTDGAPQLLADLAERRTQTAAQQAALAEAEAAAARSAAAGAALQRLDDADADDRRAAQALVSDLASLDGQIEALAAGGVEDRLVALSALRPLLAELERTLAALATAVDAGAQAREMRDTAAATAREAAAQMTEALARAAGADAIAAALTEPAERAGLALSEAARHMRVHLSPGEPCPVCGATDHPAHADAALESLAADLKAKLAAARAAAESARAQHGAAQARHAEASATARQSAANADALDARAAEARQAWSVLRARAMAVVGCPALPVSPDGAAPVLATAMAGTDAALAAAQDAAAAVSALRQRRQVLERQQTALSAAAVSRATARRQFADDLVAAQAAEAVAQRAEAAAAGAVAALDRRLSVALSPLGAGVDAADPDLPVRLAALFDRVRAARTEADDAQRKAGELARRAEQAALKATDLARAVENAAGAHDGRLSDVAALQSRRAGLLGGEPTESHRQRHERARDAAAAALAGADRSLGAARVAVAAAGSAAEAARQTEAAAGLARDAGAAELDALLLGAGLSREEAESLLSVDRTEIDRLRAQLEALATELAAARNARLGRQDDLARIDREGALDPPLEDAAASLAALDAAQTMRAERAGEIVAALAADAAALAGLRALDAQIAEARATVEVWAAVNAAVGSRTGDRFARIAQEVTLDGLVARANAHLADLAPRYRLQRAAGLSLLVADGDMGGELRATRSLSGGERFLASLALALALSRMGGRGGLAATLFIDEGFGTLDAASLDIVLEALERLQSQGRQVGVISHVEAMQDRIPVRIRVTREGGGRSRVRVEGPGA